MPITRFSTAPKHSYPYFSNKYLCEIEWEDRAWPSVEHAFQAAKNPYDPAYIKALRRTRSALAAKMLGKKATPTSYWLENRMLIMYHLINYKFRRYKRFGQGLINTYPIELIDTNMWDDTYWGQYGGVGENHVGRILMRVRVELMADRAATRESRRRQADKILKRLEDSLLD